jgi:hypothetical protein
MSSKIQEYVVFYWSFQDFQDLEKTTWMLRGYTDGLWIPQWNLETVSFLVKQLIYRTAVVQSHTFNLFFLVVSAWIIISFLNVWRFKQCTRMALRTPPLPVRLLLPLISSSFVQPNLLGSSSRVKTKLILF